MCEGARMRRSDLPRSLGTEFSVTQAVAAGVSRSRLRARDLEHPFHAVRSASGAPESGSAESRVLSRARQFATVMGESSFFGHVTAAIIWGVPLPASVIDDHLDVTVFAPQRAPRGRGVRGYSLAPTHGSARVHPMYGWRVASPATTWAMLGARLTHPYDLVAAADHLVRVPRMPGGFAPPSREAWATLAELEAAVAAGRRPGIVALRGALPRVRTAASSRRETWLRLILVDAGLPEPDLDHDVFDADGQFVACLDLAYPKLKIGIEYDGDHHRTDPVQWARDVDRLDRLTEEGWRVVRATKQHIFRSSGVVVQRVRNAIAARRGV
jgi:hypothetical protein